jgi:hypothetical protein
MTTCQQQAFHQIYSLTLLYIAHVLQVCTATGQHCVEHVRPFAGMLALCWR